MIVSVLGSLGGDAVCCSPTCNVDFCSGIWEVLCPFSEYWEGFPCMVEGMVTLVLLVRCSFSPVIFDILEAWLPCVEIGSIRRFWILKLSFRRANVSDIQHHCSLYFPLFILPLSSGIVFALKNGYNNRNILTLDKGAWKRGHFVEQCDDAHALLSLQTMINRGQRGMREFNLNQAYLGRATQGLNILSRRIGYEGISLL